jgi:hypothetical protein
MLHFLVSINQWEVENFCWKNYSTDEFGENDFNLRDRRVALSSNPYPKIPFLILFSIYFTLRLQS